LIPNGRRLDPLCLLKRAIRPRAITLYSVPLIDLSVTPIADLWA